MSTDIFQVLLAGVSGDNNRMREANQQLQHFEQTNFSEYLLSLIRELGTETGRPSDTRQLAGIMIKNALVARDIETVRNMQRRWTMLPEQVIASIASVDLPENRWPDLIATLDRNIRGPNIFAKQASFECLGFVCEENGERLREQSNMILNAIASGMAETEKNNDIKYAATTALANSLDFVEKNMGVVQERDFIMSMIFSVVSSEDIRVRVAALQCLVTIANNYYAYLQSYINDIFRLTSAAIDKEVEEVQLQAIEFWSTVSEKEIWYMQDEEDVAAEDPSFVSNNKHYIVQALPELVPRILVSLTRQTEDPEDHETWNVAMAAAACLQLVAQAAGDKVIQHVLPFVTAHINSPDWRYREAATIAFGCVLDGPATSMHQLVKDAFPVLLTHMNDRHPLVKDTAAWTLGKICDLLPETTLDHLAALIEAFLRGLRDPQPGVAAHSCWGIHNLASAVQDDTNHATNALTQFFPSLMVGLMQLTERPDADQNNLLSPAYETINALIESAATQSYGVIIQLIHPIGLRLQNAINIIDTPNADRERLSSLQALLCGCLQTIIKRLDDKTVQHNADNFMTLLLAVLKCKNASANEEAFMAIGALAPRVQKAFEKYMEALRPFLLEGLSNEKEWKLVQVAVGLVGDISRALDNEFARAHNNQLGDELMRILLTHLDSRSIERSVKPHIISCLGDIALAEGSYFQKYLPWVFRVLIPASKLSFNTPGGQQIADEDLDYLDALRESILGCYTGILQGLAADNVQEKFLAGVPAGHDRFEDPLPHVMIFFEIIANDDDQNQVGNIVLKAACGLIGDLCSTLGRAFQRAIMGQDKMMQSMMRIIQSAKTKKKEDATLEEQAKWAEQELVKLARLT